MRKAQLLTISMQPTQPIIQLWHHINPRRRRQFGLLLVLMVIASFTEILSIGAVLPFLGVLTAPVLIFEHPSAQFIIQRFGLTEPAQLLLPISIAFGVAVILAMVLRLMLMWTNSRLSYATGADLSMSIYRRTLFQPYRVHIIGNTSEVINSITNGTDIVIGIINNVLNLISTSVMLIVIIIALLSIEPVVTLAAFSGFGLIYAFIIWVIRKRLLSNSQCITRESTQLIKSLQEGLGGIRDVLIDGSQDTFCQIYRNADQPLRHAQGDNNFIANSPRYAMEAFGILLIVTLAYIIAQKTDGISKVIPTVGVLAFGSQRLLPIMQQAYAAWSYIRGFQASMIDVLKALDQPLPAYADQSVVQPLPFKHHITLKQLSFRYSQQTQWVLKNINLTIAKGSRIGFIGTTGSGKSTLLDIVMGLLQPTKGGLVIDNQPVTVGNHRAWQVHIAHVPQAIFLADSSIEENIAFGVPKDQIDRQRVRQAAQQAQIADTIENWPEQYQTFVGERGIRLSGGQRQRIGIARALYKQADVIIFDEATSALDNETELAVMQAIEDLSKDFTLLIIAHRLTTLKSCTQIVELGEGGIKRTGSYQHYEPS